MPGPFALELVLKEASALALGDDFDPAIVDGLEFAGLDIAPCRNATGAGHRRPFRDPITKPDGVV